MLEILGRFGHNFDPSGPHPLGFGDKLRGVLDKPTRVSVLWGKTFYGFDKVTMEFFGYVKERRRQLLEELHRSTDV
jgi:hypothetical protein